MSTRSRRSARYGGLVLGGAVAAGLVWQGAVPPNALAARDLAARVTVTSESSAQVSVNSAGAFISDEPVSRRPHREAAGSFRVYNPTLSKLTIRIGAEPSNAELDAHLKISIKVADRQLYSGTLAGLRTAETSSFPLARGAQATITVHVSVAHSAGAGYQARSVRIPLRLEAEAGSR